jgi:hypothetical protein
MGNYSSYGNRFYGHALHPRRFKLNSILNQILLRLYHLHEYILRDAD